MAELLLMNATCETVDVKEEYAEEDDPLLIATNSGRGNAIGSIVLDDLSHRWK